jgi:uncharacterized protein (DUF1697 family)
MPKVVFLKGVNVGGHRTFRPSQIANKLAKYRVINVGAAGTFVVCKPITEKKLRVELRRLLPFESEVMVCRGEDVLELVADEASAKIDSLSNVVRFVSVLAKAPRLLPAFPLDLPAGQEWLVRISGVRERFALGQYKRTMKTISVLSQIERRLGGSITTRNWNTIEKIAKVLRIQAPEHGRAGPIITKK